MIVCPVCEHPQDKGDACDVCGKALVTASLTAEQYPTLPELEQTAVVARNVVSPPVALMPDLEVHRAGEVQIAPEKLAGLEATTVAGAGAAGDVLLVEVIPGVEPTRLADGGQRTVLAPTMACRYCGQVQARTNLLCERCANALPRAIPAAAAKKSAAKVRCIGCGMDAEVGQSCPSCGFFIRPPED